jgi:hypothetical protein
MKQDFCPFNVAEKLDAHTHTLMGAFDKAGYIGNDEGFKIAVFDHAEIWRQGGEGIIGYLGARSGYARYKG